MSGWFFFPCHLYQTPPFALLQQLKVLSLGWAFFPCHLYQTPPFALLRQIKGLSLGWLFFPCHLYQTAPLCPVMAVKRAIPGVVLLPLPFIPDSPLCPVMTVKRAIPGVVLLPLPFIPDSPLCPVMAVKRAISGVIHLTLPFISGSPQFALSQQLKGLSALYLSGIAWLPGFRLSSLSKFNPFSYPMFLKKVESHSLCHAAFGQRSCLPLLPYGRGVLRLLKCLGTGIRMLCYFTLRCLLPLDCNLLIPLLSLSSLQTFLLHNLLHLGLECN